MRPRDTLSRKRGFMDFGLFEKIMKEVSSESRKPVTHLHGFEEPLLDKCSPRESSSQSLAGLSIRIS